MSNGARAVGHVVACCFDSVLSSWAVEDPAESIYESTTARNTRWFVGVVCGSLTATDSRTCLDCYFTSRPVVDGWVKRVRRKVV